MKSYAGTASPSRICGCAAKDVGPDRDQLEVSECQSHVTER
jgi:hypothetical protein